MFDKIRQDLEKYDQHREDLIKQARVVLKAAKLLIYAVHRTTEVKKQLAQAQKEKKTLDTIAKRDQHLASEGSYSEAVE